jgi:hypothetical protein
MLCTNCSYTASFQAALAVVLKEQLEVQKAAAASQDPFSPFYSEIGMRLNHLLVRDFSFTCREQGIQSNGPKDFLMKCHIS